MFFTCTDHDFSSTIHAFCPFCKLADARKIEEERDRLRDDIDLLRGGIYCKVKVEQLEQQIAALTAEVAKKEVEYRELNTLFQDVRRSLTDTGIELIEENATLTAELAGWKAQHEADLADNQKICATVDGLRGELKGMRGLLREARTTLEMWKDAAPAISLCADIDKALSGSPAPVCTWTETDDYWSTGCGNAFTLETGTPEENQMGFYCYCGRRIRKEKL